MGKERATFEFSVPNFTEYRVSKVPSEIRLFPFMIWHREENELSAQPFSFEMESPDKSVNVLKNHPPITFEPGFKFSTCTLSQGLKFRFLEKGEHRFFLRFADKLLEVALFRAGK